MQTSCVCVRSYIPNISGEGRCTQLLCVNSFRLHKGTAPVEPNGGKNASDKAKYKSIRTFGLFFLIFFFCTVLVFFIFACFVFWLFFSGTNRSRKQVTDIFLRRIHDALDSIEYTHTYMYIYIYITCFTLKFWGITGISLSTQHNTHTRTAKSDFSVPLFFRPSRTQILL